MNDLLHEPPAGPDDEALASFVLLAKFLGIPAEPDQIHRDRGQGDRPYSFDDLIRVAKKLGLIARHRRATANELPRLRCLPSRHRRAAEPPSC